MIDLDFVSPGLALGACFPMEAAARLAAEHGIARVVDVRVEDCDDATVLLQHGIRLLHLPTLDTRAVSQQQIRRGVAFVSQGLDAGERVLVHCQYGIGRSALLALCVLVERGLAPLAALELAKQARPVISPSPEQLQAFSTFSATLREERGARWGVPTVDQLGAIAWQHLRLREEDRPLDRARASSTRARS